MRRERNSDKRDANTFGGLLRKQKQEPAPSSVKLLFSPSSGSFIGFAKRTPEEIAEIERERENRTRKEKENETNEQST
jgi:hypothetical protein